MIHSEKYNAIQTVTVMIHGKKKRQCGQELYKRYLKGGAPESGFGGPGGLSRGSDP